MSSLHITVVRPDDERLEIQVNGEVVTTVNHDEHGWAGMEAVEKTTRSIAEAAGIDISDQYGSDDDVNG